MGNNAVTGIGTASEIHQTIIHAATAITRIAGESVHIPIQEMAIIKPNIRGPSHMPTVLTLEVVFS
jgi:hypothetical protein